MAFRTRRISKAHDSLLKDIEEGRLLCSYAESDDLENVRRLIEKGASVNALEFNRNLFYASKNYMTPLQICALKGFYECVRYLIQCKADLDAKDRFDITALHLAGENGHLGCLKLLLDAGADCTVGTKYSKHGSYTAVPHVGGTTALHLAARNNHTECVHELILNGADYNAVDELGRTSLYIASQLGYEDCVLIHLKSAVGRDILSLPVTATGDTPLHECVKNGMDSAVVELLKHGSDVNHKNLAGYSPLHLAVHSSDKYSLQIVKELVKKGFNTDVNLMDGSRNTPLNYVCMHDNPCQDRRPDAAAFLIAYGAQWQKLQRKNGTGLIHQELLHQNEDSIILKTITDTTIIPPSLESLGLGTWTGIIMTSSDRLHVKEKVRWYQELRSNPPTLAHYCRFTIWNAMRPQRLKFVNQLPLPQTVKEYLLLYQ